MCEENQPRMGNCKDSHGHRVLYESIDPPRLKEEDSYVDNLNRFFGVLQI